MNIRFSRYNYGYHIVSLALNETARDDLISNAVETLYVSDACVTLFPGNIVLSKDAETAAQLNTYNNYDVLEIWDNGVVIRRYNDASNENYFFVTSRCNSNCIMCPSAERARKNAQDVNMNTLMKIAEHIPSDTSHLTITGGEPFLAGERIFPFVNYLKGKFTNTEFLFLTNGRVFALDKYTQLFKQSIPPYSIVAIPIHGSCSEVHDMITRAPNSFEQTKTGIKKLLKHGISVELRIVVSKLNLADFDNIAQMIINEFRNVEYVSIIAMEMTGNARIHKAQVWIPYKETFSAISNSVMKMVKSGINVRLYNFPLCTVEPAFWTLCEKSISENKIRHAEDCKHCKYKQNCGGVFAGTFQLEKGELKPIL